MGYFFLLYLLYCVNIFVSLIMEIGTYDLKFDLKVSG